MKIIAHTLPGGAQLNAYLHENVLNPEQGEETPRPAMILCPGGGYSFTSPREADPPAMAFLNMGFQVFILYYRVGDQAGNLQPMEDLARSVLWVRENSSAWNIDPVSYTHLTML